MSSLLCVEDWLKGACHLCDGLNLNTQAGFQGGGLASWSGRLTRHTPPNHASLFRISRRACVLMHLLSWLRLARRQARPFLLPADGQSVEAGPAQWLTQIHEA